MPELQRYLDDPMSDPDVRRDEETRTTTVEHIKLLRNRLEATTKEQIDGLQAYLVRATNRLSEGLGIQPPGLNWEDSAGLLATEKAASTATRGAGVRGSAAEDGIMAAKANAEELPRMVNYRFRELEEKLEARTAILEDRVGLVIEERLGELSRKLDALLQKS